MARTFYLGTHLPGWLAKTDAPLFVSRTRLVKRRTFPRAAARWALDSGAFTELSLHGRWTVPPARYAQEARLFIQEIGRLDFAAPQDWMCEPWILQTTGLSVAEHQRRTLRSFLELQDLAPEVPWIPVLQGWAVHDYWRHAEMYSASGVDLAKSPLVGVGSVCRRQATRTAGGILASLATVYGLRLHAFGFKTSGFDTLLPTSNQPTPWRGRSRPGGRRNPYRAAPTPHAPTVSALLSSGEAPFRRNGYETV